MPPSALHVELHAGVRSPTLLLAVALLAACAEGPVEESPGEPWSISDEPRVEVGDDASDERYQLFQVAGAVRQADGTLVVANGGTGELRFYASDGKWVRTVAGEGGGPGEFQWLVRLGRLPGDSLYAFDRNAQRVSIFAPDGRFARDASPSAAVEPGFLHDLLPLGDGSWVSVEKRFSSRSPRPGEMSRREIVMIVRDPAFEVPSELARVPDQTWVGTSAGGRAIFREALFTPRTLYSTLGSCIIATPGDSPSLLTLNPSSGAIDTLRAEAPATPLEDHHFDSYLDWYEEERQIPAEELPRAREALLSYPRLDSLPRFDRLLTDHSGYVWLREYVPPYSADGSAAWRILSPDGSAVATARTPVDLEIHEIGSDWVLGVRRDALDVERLALFPLERHGGSAEAAQSCGPR